MEFQGTPNFNYVCVCVSVCVCVCVCVCVGGCVKRERGERVRMQSDQQSKYRSHTHTGKKAGGREGGREGEMEIEREGENERRETNLNNASYSKHWPRQHTGTVRNTTPQLLFYSQISFGRSICAHASSNLSILASATQERGCLWHDVMKFFCFNRERVLQFVTETGSCTCEIHTHNAARIIPSLSLSLSLSLVVSPKCQVFSSLRA